MPHLVGAPCALGELEVMGDQGQAERLGPLQLREKIDDVVFGVLVEVAGRFVGEQQAR